MTEPETMPIRVAIIGSRQPSEFALKHVVMTVNDLPAGTIVVTGGALGIDVAAEEAALARGMHVEVHKPQYDLFGIHAPKVRNTVIVARCTRMIAYTAGSKGGSYDAIRQAQRFGKPFQVIGG